MARPRIHRLRSALWRLNALLALGVVCLAWSVASAPDPSSTSLPRDWDAEAAPSSAGGDWRPKRESLEEIMAVFDHFYPAPEEVVAAPEAVVPTRLPLRAFEIAMVVHDDERGYLIMLDSKDPAYDDSYLLEAGVPDRDAELLRVREADKSLFALVRRGIEEFEFETPLRAGGFVRLDIIRDATPRPVRSHGGGEVPILASRPALKGVPYFEDGRMVGLRVTGIRPNSWAVDLGLKRGDVIRQVNDAAVSDALATKKRLRNGEVPKTINVTRVVNSRHSRMTLSRG